MTTLPVNIDEIFQIKSTVDFNEKALKIFHFQAENCNVYKEFLHLLGKNHLEINAIEEIPFLPIELFKTQKVITNSLEAKLVFKSSGTGNLGKSQHHVADPSLYERSFLSGFKQFYGDPKDFLIIGLLPSYQEQGDSSLVYMVEKLIERSQFSSSNFYLNNDAGLKMVLENSNENGIPTLLIGVTYALLDFSEKYPMDLKKIIIMETGGMKGRKTEMIRSEVHAKLSNSFGIKAVHSEYGMTELLSQAYSKGDGIFHCPAWLRIGFRENTSPMYTNTSLNKGIITIIDLANLYSCSFIATQDLGKRKKNGVEILGRTDYSDIRGCSQLTL
ncbi:MAG: acyl transferase [Crocinitomicaceae bacterium]|jgi:hypothetical protein|nr:acyl transferase [Crocinitomicaceae bacterium]